MAYFTSEQVREAVKAHNTIFFNADLQPVEPKEGQWFCEFHVDDSDEEVLAEAIVEYLGMSESAFLTDNGWVEVKDHRVASEYDESDRRPYGDILVLQ